uniref:Bacterial repeat domain-containing protein n=1 Tax=viral metagenome TaxID=1070528 RepID=A0A6M3M026_9ZZZZ
MPALNEVGPPIATPGGIFFTLKDITFTPVSPREKEPFTVKGKIALFGMPFLAPVWVVAKVTYPERWWEEMIPIIGSPTVGEGQLTVGGNFEITFPKGFNREGEFTLRVEVHGGPTYTIDRTTIPPFPPLASEETTFIVAGEVPPEEAGFRNFRILAYSKNGGEPVTPPGVLEVGVSDRIRVKLGFDHRNFAVDGEIHAAVWQKTLLDPHDEVLNNDKFFNVPASIDWKSYEESIDILITSEIKAGNYGLYAKIMGITGADIFTEYLENVINITTEELQTLEIDITPVGAGYVTTAPDPEVGANHFTDGSTGDFRYDQKVMVEAHPNEGYRFDHWSDEIEGGVSYNNPEYVAGTMTEHRAVKAHFRSIEVPEELQTLEVDITPVGAGYVMTTPAPEVGDNYFTNGVTGQFLYGERVKVTAHANPGYEFEKWSDEIEGGVSYNNPEYVAGTMTEHKAVKAHFREIVEYKGTITRLELKYNATQKPIPVTDIPQGSSGQVHVWGRNDTSEWQEMGISISVRRPDGSYVQYSDISGGHCPGCDHEFISDRFDLQALGEYRISAFLWMNEKQVDNYEGPLCTVISLVEELETLEVDITPSGTGYVTTEPAPEVGTNYFVDGTTGQFKYGETVRVTAHANPGYEFDHWSDEIEGGVSYNNPEYVAGTMTEHKAVKAHFREVAVVPELGNFTFYAINMPPLYHIESWMVRWWDNGKYYDSNWESPTNPVVVHNAPLEGKIEAWIWTGTGDPIKYGPTSRYTLRDGGVYSYDISAGILYTR